MKNLQPCKIKNLEFIREISDIKYEIESNNDESKCKAKDGGYKKIKKYLLIGMEKMKY